MKVIVHSDIKLEGEGSGEQYVTLCARVEVANGEVTLHLGELYEYTAHVETRGDRSLVVLTCVKR